MWWLAQALWTTQVLTLMTSSQLLDVFQRSLTYMGHMHLLLDPSTLSDVQKTSVVPDWDGKAENTQEGLETNLVWDEEAGVQPPNITTAKT